MYKRLSAAQKEALVQRVRSGQPITDVCKEAGVSRTIFYKWLKLYKGSANRSRSKSLSSKVVRGSLHHKSIAKPLERKIIKTALTHPDFSAKKVGELAGASAHGAWSVLKRNSLNLKKQREDRVFRQGNGLIVEKPVSDKVTMLRRYSSGEKAADLCREFKVSRTIFYRWLKKYKESGQQGESLASCRPEGEKHWRFIPGAVDLVLKTVSSNPNLTHKKISSFIKAQGVNLGHHGVYNILRRNGLNTLAKRLLFAREAPMDQKAIISPLYRPEVPLYRLRQLIAPFVTVPKLLFTKPKTGIPATLLLFSPFILAAFWFKLLSFAPPSTSSLGLIFASISLLFGLFFFIYSMKYYITILLVLKLAQSGESGKLGVLGRLGKILGVKPKERVNPLLVNLEKVNLTSHPFVSIHVALYNEKRVVERLIAATTSQSYTNPAAPNYQTYEVIIADDSTDETTQIAKTYLAQQGYSVRREEFGKEREVFIFTPQSSGKGKPTVKLIHRFSRSGYKGAALQGALEITNPKAAYITIFDADFVPYPDTLQQFIKSFQALGAGSAQSGASSSQLNPIPSTLNANNIAAVPSFAKASEGQAGLSGSNIAAVQGYQWHVLNKSQNWVTRGVRTEYAGSYVIERAGEEIYGGLKQISGSVYCIRADVLRQFGWGTSITEDFELTLRLYEAGYKVAFTPYIQTPAEAVSTIKRLIRQRMRWAEGASFNVKVMLKRMLWGKWEESQSVIARSETTKQSNSKIASLTLAMTEGKVRTFVPSPLTRTEKLEFAYLAPYYLQAAFFVIGTISWFMAEAVFGARLPFWTAAFGWSLVFTNMLSLPLMNIIGLFLEESEERDYLGILSFVALSYIVVPFQAYAAIKGFIEKKEGPWFRTPKTGTVTDTFGRSTFGKFFGNILGSRRGIATFGSTAQQTAGLAFAKAYNPLTAANFHIKRRHTKWVGNLALGLVIITTVAMTVLAPYVPLSTAMASGQSFASPRTTPSAESKLETQGDVELDGPIAQTFKLDEEKSLDFIFHPDPRVRIKLGSKEVQMKVVSSPGLGKVFGEPAIKRGNSYFYKEIFQDVDLRFTQTGTTLQEDFILKKYRDFESIDEEIELRDLVLTKYGDQILLAAKDGGYSIMSFGKPFMYEQNNTSARSEGITYQIEKNQFGYKLRKVLTQEGKRWLSNPQRNFPVVFDPPTMVQSSPITSGITNQEMQWGSFMRKLVYSNSSSAWYAFETDAGRVHYKKCAASSICDTDNDWGASVNISLDTVGQESVSVWYQPSGTTGAGKIVAAWVDSDSATENTKDSVAFRTIDTVNSDGLGTQCNSADLGGVTAANFYAAVAAASNGDLMVALQTHTTSDAEIGIWEVDSGISTGCTFTDRETNSGLATASQNIILVPYAGAANKVQIVYLDAGGNNDLRQSQIDVTDATTPWDYADNDVDGAANLNVKVFSAVSDGTDAWVLAAASTTDTDFFRCSPCTGATAPTWVGTDTPPYSSQANISEVSLSYISTSPSNNLIAHILKDTTNRQGYFTVSDADTISWNSGCGADPCSYNFTASSSSVYLTSTYSVANDTEVGVYLREGTAATSFSTLPERSLLLLLAAPFLPGILSRLRKRRS